MSDTSPLERGKRAGAEALLLAVLLVVHKCLEFLFEAAFAAAEFKPVVWLLRWLVFTAFSFGYAYQALEILLCLVPGIRGMLRAIGFGLAEAVVAGTKRAAAERGAAGAPPAGPQGNEGAIGVGEVGDAQQAD